MAYHFPQLLNQFDSTLEFLSLKSEIATDTPDTWICEVVTNQGIFYILETDYVDGLSGIGAALEKALGSTIELLPVLQPKSFDESEPVKSAATHKKPGDWSGIMKYASDRYCSKSYNFGFLAKKTEG